MAWNTQLVNQLIRILAVLDLVVAPLSVYCISPILKPRGLLNTSLNYIIYFLFTFIAFAYVSTSFYLLCEIIAKTRWANSVDGIPRKEGHWLILHHIMAAGLCFAALANRSWIVAFCIAAYAVITSGGALYMVKKMASTRDSVVRIELEGERSRLI